MAVVAPKTLLSGIQLGLSIPGAPLGTRGALLGCRGAGAALLMCPSRGAWAAVSVHGRGVRRLSCLSPGCGQGVRAGTAEDLLGQTGQRLPRRWGGRGKAQRDGDTLLGWELGPARSYWSSQQVTRLWWHLAGAAMSPCVPKAGEFWCCLEQGGTLSQGSWGQQGHCLVWLRCPRLWCPQLWHPCLWHPQAKCPLGQLLRCHWAQQQEAIVEQNRATASGGTGT